MWYKAQHHLARTRHSANHCAELRCQQQVGVADAEDDFGLAKGRVDCRGHLMDDNQHEAVVSSWLVMRECSLLMGHLVAAVPLPRSDDCSDKGWLLDCATVVGVADTFVRALLTMKHMGSIMFVAQGLEVCVTGGGGNAVRLLTHPPPHAVYRRFASACCESIALHRSLQAHHGVCWTVCCRNWRAGIKPSFYGAPRALQLPFLPSCEQSHRYNKGCKAAYGAWSGLPFLVLCAPSCSK